MVGVDDFVDEAGFPYAGLTDDGHHLPLPRPGPLQGLLQGRQLRLPSHKARQATGGGHLQTPPQGTDPDQLEHLHRLRQAFDRHGAQGRDLDEPFGQPQRLGGEANAPGRGQLLHACRQVCGLANRRIVHMQVVTDGAYHHLPRVEANADLHLHTVCAAHLGAIAAYGLLHSQGSVTGAHGVILMRHWRAKQRHDAVAHDLVHRTLIAVHGRHQTLQYRVEELTRFLGIAVAQQFHGALQVREQHGDLLALAFQGTLRRADLLDEVWWRIDLRRGSA